MGIFEGRSFLYPRTGGPRERSAKIPDEWLYIEIPTEIRAIASSLLKDRSEVLLIPAGPEAVAFGSDRQATGARRPDPHAGSGPAAEAERIVETLHEPLLVLDSELHVRRANPAFYEAFSPEPGETVGTSVFDVDGGLLDAAKLREKLQGGRQGGRFVR